MAGSTTFPTSVDNKTQLTDGVDIIQADDVNDSYVPIDAIETFVGVSGAAQSHNTDIMAILEQYLPTLKLKWVDANTVQASAGICVITNAAGSIRKLRKNTGTTNIAFSDIDTGARAVSTTYYIYAIADAAASTITFKISASSSAPTGITNYKLVGGFATNATGAGEIISTSVWSKSLIKIHQIQNSIATGNITISTAIPYDNSKPQNTEGGEVTTLSITPASATSYFLILSALHANSDTAVGKVLALFKDSGADAIRAVSQRPNSSDAAFILMPHIEASVSLATTTFKIRAGLYTAGNLYVNADTGGTQLFAGLSISGIIVIEFE